MKVKYFNKEGNLLSCTEDYIPNINECVTIDDIIYEVENRKINIVALHTEVDVYLMEKIHG